MGVLFALVAGFIQGIAYTITKRSYTDFPPSVSFYIRAILGLLILIPYALIAGIDWNNFLPTLFYAFLSALLAEAMAHYALSKGKISISTTVFSTYPVFTILFSHLLIGEKLEGLTLILIGLIIVAIIVISFPNEKIKWKENIYILWPLVAAITVGISDTLSKNSIATSDSSTFLFALAISQIPVSIIFLMMERQKAINIVDFVKNFKEYKYAFWGPFLLVVSLIFFWLAFENTLASIASPLTGSYVIFVLIFARIFLKEKVSKKDLIFSMIIISCITLLSISL